MIDAKGVRRLHRELAGQIAISAQDGYVAAGSVSSVARLLTRTDDTGGLTGVSSSRRWVVASIETQGGHVDRRMHQALRVARRDLRMILRFLQHDYFARDAEQKRRQRLRREWVDGGRVGPPPHIVKQEAVRRAAQAGGIRAFVETGTLHGDMIAAVASDFDRLYSIELSHELYLLARLRFLGRRHINLIQGDSSEKLAALLDTIDCPCVFWLDGHYGGGVMARGKKDVPIVEELTAILAHRIREHVILIDDAGIFERAAGDTPSLAELEEMIRAVSSTCDFVVEDNMILVTLG